MSNNAKIVSLMFALYVMLIVFFALATAYVAPGTGLIGLSLVAVPLATACVYVFFSMLPAGAAHRLPFGQPVYIVATDGNLTLESVLEAVKGMGLQQVVLAA